MESIVSVSGKHWEFRTADERLLRTLQQKFGVSAIVAQIMCNRDVLLEETEAFLNPTLRELLPEPYTLNGMQAAVQRVAKALDNHEKITVYGDYDVDGATSVAQLICFFRAIGHPVEYYIPDRLNEGYGVNAEAIEALHASGTQLILMVDCGTTSISEVARASELGMDSIIIDHHAPGPALPRAVAVINAHRLDQPATPTLQNLCAAGVVFIFLIALQRHLRTASSITHFPDLMSFCPIVALGTVCDVMPLTGLNRAIVRRGLEGFWSSPFRGLHALAETAAVHDALRAYHLGFVLGPRINAGGRVGTSTLGAELLSTQDPIRAAHIAQQLDTFNAERHALEQQALEEAIQQIEASGSATTAPALLAVKEGWHPGVVGIVASRLVERYQRPCLVGSLKDGRISGSGRSVRGVNLGACIIQAREAGFLSKGGGHSMAVGFAFTPEQKENFYKFLCEHTRSPMQTYRPTLLIDAELTLAGATSELVSATRSLEPFGIGNPTPKWCFRRVRAVAARPVGKGHLQCQLVDASGTRCSAIAFKSAGTPLEASIASQQPIAIAGTVQENSWGGRKNVQIIIEDAASECQNGVSFVV